MTSRRTFRSKAPLTSMVSRMDPMDRQKKKRSEMEWSCFGVLEELEVTGAHLRPDGFEGCGHLLRVVLQVDRLAVFEEAAPLRVETHHGDVVFEFAAGLVEDLAQD